MIESRFSRGHEAGKSSFEYWMFSNFKIYNSVPLLLNPPSFTDQVKQGKDPPVPHSACVRVCAHVCARIWSMGCVLSYVSSGSKKRWSMGRADLIDCGFCRISWLTVKRMSSSFCLSLFVFLHLRSLPPSLSPSLTSVIHFRACFGYDIYSFYCFLALVQLL